jgi:hypothetical protein
MSITTYAELKTALATWLNRSDSDIDARAAEFIALGEGRMRGDRRLRLRVSMFETTLVTVAGTSTVLLPGDYQQAVSIYRDGDPKRPLTQMSGEQLASIYAGNTSGEPSAYTVQGYYLKLGPTPDAAYTLYMLYYYSFPALSVSQTTNALLTNYPNVYLYAALAEAPEYLIDGNVNWSAKYDEAVNRLSDSDKAGINSGSVLQTRTDVGSP